MSQIIDKNANNDAKKRILQYANDVMHEELANNNIVIVAIHDRADPRKFTIVADSDYDKQLEGVSLIFNDQEDFRRIFPQFANPPPPVLAPNMELDKRTNTAHPIHQDPYIIQATFSYPKPENPAINSSDNIKTKDKTLTWSVNKNPVSLVMDLGSDSEIGTVWIAWGSGDKRQYKFTIAVALAEQMQGDNKTFTVIDHLANVYSSGTTDELEPYKLVTDPDMAIKARYVMVKVYGNTVDNWATVSQSQITKAVSIRSAETKQNPQDNVK